jgi:predicted nucleic acid-binding protein
LSDSHALHRALLDTASLYPAVLRDTLLRAAEAGLYLLLVSEEILLELVQALPRDSSVSRVSAARLVESIRVAFPGSIVPKDEHVLQTLQNHPDDRHVLAAAIVGRARTIVTPNLRHFPSQALDGTGIVATSPDAFLVSLMKSSPHAMNRVLTQQAADLRRPPLTVEDVLQRRQVQAPWFVKSLQEYRSGPQQPG